MGQAAVLLSGAADELTMTDCLFIQLYDWKEQPLLSTVPSISALLRQTAIPNFPRHRDCCVSPLQSVAGREGGWKIKSIC